jgi:hypothetical protein
MLMNPFRLIVDGLKVIRDIVNGVRDARRASVEDALTATYAGQAAARAAERAGHGPAWRASEVERARVLAAHPEIDASDYDRGTRPEEKP